MFDSFITPNVVVTELSDPITLISMSYNQIFGVSMSQITIRTSSVLIHHDFGVALTFFSCLLMVCISTPSAAAS